jgi:hypothetical protein
MKKITYCLFLSFLTTIVVLSSCTKKDAEVVKPAPTVNYISGQGMVTGTTTLTPGSIFKVGIAVAAAGDNLASFSVDRNGAAISEFNGGVLSKSISGSTYSDTLEITAPAANANYTYNFTATTTDNKKTTLTLTIIVKNQVGGPIVSYNSIMLGVQTNTSKGGFFATSTHQIFAMDDAKTNSSLVDMVYLSNNNQSIFISPSDAIVKQAYPSVDSWTTLNETLFQSTTLTAAQFDNITGDPEILLAYDGATGFAKSITNPLTVGTVVAFKTIANKKGLLKITNVTTDINGTITFDVKVQQ